MITLKKCVALVFIAVLLVSCGGGTSGTGGVTLSGTVYDVSLKPLAGVRVSETTSGASAESDLQGLFSLKVPQLPSLTLIFETGESSAAVELSDLSKSVATISADFEFDTQRQSVRTEHLQQRERGKPDVEKNDDQGNTTPGGKGVSGSTGSQGDSADPDDKEDGESSSGGKDAGKGQAPDSNHGSGTDAGSGESESGKDHNAGKSEDAPGQDGTKGPSGEKGVTGESVGGGNPSNSGIDESSRGGAEPATGSEEMGGKSQGKEQNADNLM